MNNKKTRNNKKTIKLILASILTVFGLAFCISQSKAASTSLPAPVNSITVATVNIYDAKMVSQEKNRLKISFDLSNRELVQPDVHYAVQLMKKDVNTLSVVDEKIYPETINLGKNETLKKEIEYLAPQYLNGKFRLWLVAKNASGMNFSSANLGEITLAGDNQYVGIDTATCYLKVVGESGDKKYNPRQGVDISSEEKLIATCDAMNYSDTSLTLTPQIKTYWRSTFGKLVEDNKEPQTVLSFEAKKQKTISITLPKASLPQAYDAVLELVDNRKKVLSTPVAFHYVLQGASATIQSFIMDKAAYQKGETAKASFFWTPSADIFPDSRAGLYSEKMAMTMQIEIKNSKGANCISPTNEALDATKNALNFSYPIITECNEPKIAISIKDAKGNILDKKEYSLEAQAQKAVVEKLGTAKTEKSLLTYVIILVVVLLIISFGLIYFKKNNGNGGDITKLTIFLILLAGGLFLSASGVRADTWTAYVAGTVKGSGEPTDIPINFDVSLNKAVYAPNEEIKVSGTAMSFICANSSNVNIELTGETNGSEKTLIPRSMYGYSGTVYINGGDPVIFQAPSVPGTYKMHYAGEVGYHSTPTEHDTYYTVVDPCVQSCSGDASCKATQPGFSTEVTTAGTKCCTTGEKCYNCIAPRIWDSLSGTCKDPSCVQSCSGDASCKATQPGFSTEVTTAGTKCCTTGEKCYNCIAPKVWDSLSGACKDPCTPGNCTGSCSLPCSPGICGYQTPTCSNSCQTCPQTYCGSCSSGWQEK
jgi:hypothetical protein